ncbi:TonB-dependent receptor domain-containing protein [Pacificibacter marinus]|uniref:Ferrichrome-iron receptor n=1 Tax=Pacificibacter marinus TaxID=658057 RepID=A0A1Y5SDL6_9RHOB|nr:TonB-dependent receptor [Pacificibacter marinus]SEK51390.1 TonB dependent receptor [Pacificibacter marinus]SLN37963.1 Ferrichrome-iron receptor precursor [Pacificibacter marinus]
MGAVGIVPDGYGEVKSQGIELEARGRLTDTLQGVASYTYLETEITESSDSSLIGNENAFAPNHQASLCLDYDGYGCSKGEGRVVSLALSREF